MLQVHEQSELGMGGAARPAHHAPPTPTDSRAHRRKTVEEDDDLAKGNRLNLQAAHDLTRTRPARPVAYLRRIKLFTRAMATLTIDSPAMTPDETGTT